MDFEEEIGELLEGCIEHCELPLKYQDVSVCRKCLQNVGGKEMGNEIVCAKELDRVLKRKAAAPYLKYREG